ncbi:MAG TPA: glycosyltransferase [Spirochaetota bacterium]|nr:glycosyltransferase [Spirochaetota bacterium]
MPRVSVVLPVYNCERYLREALESVLNQSFRDFETVVVDDGSNDGSGSIIKEYISLAGFTIVTHKENMGICRTDTVRGQKGGKEKRRLVAEEDPGGGRRSGYNP